MSYYSFYTSNKKDAPCPPPIHSVARPSLSSLLFNSLRAVKTIRAPLIPTGCPKAIAPPFIFKIDSSISPAIEAFRNKTIHITPGGGGKYGEISFDKKSEKREAETLTTLDNF